MVILFVVWHEVNLWPIIIVAAVALDTPASPSSAPCIPPVSVLVPLVLVSAETTAPWIVPPPSLFIVGLDIVGPTVLLQLVASTLVLGSVGMVVIILRPSRIIIIIIITS